MEKRYVEGADDDGQIQHPFTKGQLGFLLGIPKSLTREQACVTVGKSVKGCFGAIELLVFRLKGDVGLDQHAGGGDGIEVMDWVIKNSYEGGSGERKINSQRVVDLIFQLRDEAGNGRKA